MQKFQIYLQHPYGDLKGSASIFDLRPRSNGDLTTYIGHVAYHLIRLDKRNIFKPTPGLYLNPIKSYKQKCMQIDTMTSLFDLNDLSWGYICKVAPRTSTIA